MTVEELLRQSFGNADLFWAAIGAIAQAVQALAVGVSAIVIFWQLRQIRQESIANKIAGLRAAIETIDTTVFKQVSTQALSGSNIHGIDWDELLDQINRVAVLIREGYTDETLFLSQRGTELAAISRYLKSHINILPDWESRFRSASNLLNSAEQFKPKK